MEENTVYGIICAEDELKTVYEVCRISQLTRADGTIDYTFLPNYAICDLLDSTVFPGITGLNLDLRRPRFMRVRTIPEFIEERTPSPSDEYLQQSLAAADLDMLDRLEWLIRTGYRFPTDGLFVIRDYEHKNEPISIESVVTLSKNTEHACKEMLRLIGCNAPLTANGNVITGEALKAVHDTVRSLYEKGHSYRLARQRDGIATAAQHGRLGKGRQITLEKDTMDDVMSRFSKGLLSANEAAKALDVSRATFYRKLKAWSEGFTQ